MAAKSSVISLKLFHQRVLNFFYRDLFKISLNLYRRSYGAPLTPFGRGNVKMKSGPKLDMKKSRFRLVTSAAESAGGDAETDSECTE